MLRPFSVQNSDAMYKTTPTPLYKIPTLELRHCHNKISKCPKIQNFFFIAVSGVELRKEKDGFFRFLNFFFQDAEKWV